MKKALLLLIFQLAISAQAQQRDRLAELNVVCRNERVTYTSVAPDGSLWMATNCSEIYRADDIYSPWHIIQEGKILGLRGDNFENITAFDRNTAVIVGNIRWNYIKRTTTGGQLWERVNYVSKRGHEWFHPIWRGEGGNLWTGSQDGYLAFSADSGRTFNVLRDTAFDRKMGIDDIYMLSADSGWIAGNKNGLYSTSDNWRTYHRLPTPYGKGVRRVRPWKNHLIVTQSGKSYFTTVDGNGRWQRTPLTLSDFEVDNATGKMWAIDDNGEIVLMEDLDRWKSLGVSALFIIGIHDGRLYCRVKEGVMRVGTDGKVDNCPFLTAERALDAPEKTFTHGDLLWGFDEKSVYLHDAKGWYRVARPLDISGVTPDPDRNDRVIIMNYWGDNFSVDTAGHVAPYIYPQPLAAFVKPGLESVEITTFTTLGYGIHKETVGFRRDGDRLVESPRTITKESYDPHISGGHEIKTSPVAVDDDSDKRKLPVSSVEKALLALGERYYKYPTPLDFNLADTSLDLHQIYAARSTYSSNKYGYNIVFVNQVGDTLTAYGQTSAYVDLGGSTHYPWLLPMFVRWREAEFSTYQPCLWQALREVMPDSMKLREYLDNSTLHPRYTLQSGDLLFVKKNKSGTSVYTHMALVERDSADDVWIIEVSPKNDVRRLSYSQFEGEHMLGFFMGSFDIYRPTTSFDTAAVIARAKNFVGKPYDYWVKHFQELNMPVPEEIMNINPTDMILSPLLKKLK